MSAVWVPPSEERGKDHIGGATTHFIFDIGGGDSEDQGSGRALFHESHSFFTQAFRKWMRTHIEIDPVHHELFDRGLLARGHVPHP